MLFNCFVSLDGRTGLHSSSGYQKWSSHICVRSLVRTWCWFIVLIGLTWATLLSAVLVCTIKRWETAYVSSFILLSSTDRSKTDRECRDGALIVRRKKREKFLGTKLETEIKIFYATSKVPFICCTEPWEFNYLDMETQEEPRGFCDFFWVVQDHVN